MPHRPTNTIEALQNSNTTSTPRWMEKHNPTTREYTYIQKASGAHSRIDRIYVTEHIHKLQQ
jgi:hypothetical protein